METPKLCLLLEEGPRHGSVWISECFGTNQQPSQRSQAQLSLRLFNTRGIHMRMKQVNTKYFIVQIHVNKAGI